MSSGEQIGLLGSGGQADEVESFVGSKNVIFRAVTADYLGGNNPKLISLEQAASAHENVSIIAAVGAPGLRRDILSGWPHRKFATITAELTSIDKGATIGAGSVIAPLVAITTNVLLGQHVLINLGASVSHDSKLGNFVTVSPGAKIAGRAEIGDGVFIGIGATISNDVKIANGCVIGAGAVVIDDILTENSIAVGVPAKIVRAEKDWLYEI
jgi:sugar O-acyltransferase (sialic acid O-acetyltransferase NeuD family)